MTILSLLMPGERIVKDDSVKDFQIGFKFYWKVLNIKAISEAISTSETTKANDSCSTKGIESHIKESSSSKKVCFIKAA